MSASVSTTKQKRKHVKFARRINRKKKVTVGRPNLPNSSQKRKTARLKRQESNRKKKAKRREEQAALHAKKIFNFFDESAINSIGKMTRFLIRRSKLVPAYFLSTLILSYLSNGDKALILMAVNLADWFKIDVSAQALSERLKNKRTVNFLKECFVLSLNMKLKPCISNNGYAKYLTMFREIKIGDSTSIELSESLAKNFKGSGGGASKSALKLNFLMDMFSNSTTQIDVKRGSCSDRRFVKSTVRYMKKGELLIKDLGYFSLEAFKTIATKKAFYISRLLKSVKVYITNSSDDPINIGEFLKKATNNGKKIIDQHVFIGHQKLPSRLIAFKTPKWVREQRLKKFKAMHKKEPDEEYIIWAGYSVFITNIDNGVCSRELIIELYSIRWQIELLFKSYKSTLKLDIIRGTSRNSVLCMIYTKLIGILISEKLISFAAKICEEDNRELSVLRQLCLQVYDNYDCRSQPFHLESFSQSSISTLVAAGGV